MANMQPLANDPAHRWEELVRGGMSKPAAEAQVRQEFAGHPSLLGRAAAALTTPAPRKMGSVEATLRAAAAAPASVEMATAARVREANRPTLASTAASLFVNNVPSIVMPRRTEQDNQRILDQAAQAGVDVSQHAGLLAASAAGGDVAGNLALNAAVPNVGALKSGMGAGEVAGALGKQFGVNAAMGGGLTALGGGSPTDILKSAAVQGFLGAGLGALGGSPVVRDAFAPYAPNLASEAGFARISKSQTPAEVRDAMGALMTKPPSGPEPKPTLRERARTEAGRTYQALLNETHAADQFGRVVGGTEEVANAAANARGWRGNAELYIGQRGDAMPGSGPITLKQVVGAAKGIEAPVAELATARRALQLHAAGYAEKGVDIGKAQAAVAALNQRPEVVAAADHLNAFYRRLWDDRLAEGVISPEQHAEALASGDFYTPFVREWSVEHGGGNTPGGRLFQSTGSRRMNPKAVASAPIVNPFEQAVRDAQSTARDIGRQRVMNVIGEIMQSHPNESAPYLVDHGPMKASDPLAPKDRPNTIGPIINGVKHRVEVKDPDLMAALQSSSPPVQNIIKTILRAPKKSLQTGVTMHPLFSVFNFARDQGFSMLSTPLPVKRAALGAAVGGAIGAASDKEHPVEGALVGAATGMGAALWTQHLRQTIEGMSHVLKYDKLYQDWLGAGGSGMGFYARTPEEARKVVQELQRQHGPMEFFHPKTWWHAAEFVNQAVEQSTRVGEFARQRAAGATLPQAAAASREVSVDFGRSGGDPLMKEVNDVTAFFNPGIQGMDRVRRALGSKKAWAMGAAALTAPSLALWWKNKDDPAYRNIPVWEKNLFWLVPYGKDEVGTTKFLRVAKPFEPGYIFASIPERLAEFAYQRDPERAKAAFLDMLGSSAGNLLPVPTAIKAPAEAYLMGPNGWDSFRNKPVVPAGMEGLPASMQVQPRSSIVARAAGALGEKVGVPVSPVKVDHIIRGILGPLGSMALESVVDPLARVAGVDRGPVLPAQSAFEGSRLVSHNNGFNTNDVQTMFRRFDALDKVHNGFVRMDKNSDPGTAAYVEKHRAELQAWDQLRPAVAEFRQMATYRRQIEQDRTMTAEQKRLAILKLGQQAATMVTQAINGMATAP